MTKRARDHVTLVLRKKIIKCVKKLPNEKAEELYHTLVKADGTLRSLEELKELEKTKYQQKE